MRKVNIVRDVSGLPARLELGELVEPLGKYSKQPPLVLERKRKRAAEEKHRQEVRSDVFERDGGRCRCCGSYAFEMHELRFRSLGGERSRYNSIAVCDFRGNNCHRLLQTNIISYEFVDTKRGADQPVKFMAGERVWFG